MLATLGLSDVADLFAAIPADHRYPELGLGPARGEAEALALAEDLLAGNPRHLSFLGAGAYHHYIPAVVGALASRGEFTTSYTPYQAEVSQGTLTAIFEYQSMVADLLQMEVVNASHYDGATSVAEACLMALRARPTARNVVLDAGLHPEYVQVTRTYLQPQGFTTEICGSLEGPAQIGPEPEALLAAIGPQTACVVVQTPDFLGRIHDLRGFADDVHARGALLVVHTDPIAAGLFQPPGALGADIVTGEGQPLGIPLSYGGPYLGIFATRAALARKMPGRLVGQTTDAHGRRGFVLTLNTREQHIRRDKATSNICTNQGLMALRAAIYLAAMGPEGLRETAQVCYHKAAHAAAELSSLPGVSLVTPAPFFREFAVRLPIPAAQVIRRAREHGVIPGLDLSRYYQERTGELLVAVTERYSAAQIGRLVASVAAALETEAGA